MIIPLGSLLIIIISIFICALFVLFYIPYYVGIFILLTIFIFLRKRAPNHIPYVKNFTSSVVFWVNYYLDVIVARMLNNACHKTTNHTGVADRQSMYRLFANSVCRDEELQPVDFTVRHRRFDSNDRLVQSSSSKHNRQVLNSFFKRNKGNPTHRSDSTSILSPIHYNESDRNVLNTGACVNKVVSNGSGIMNSPTRTGGVLLKSNSCSMSGSSNVGNRTSRFSQTYFEMDDGMKENVNVSYSSESSMDSASVLPYRYKDSTSLHPTQENHENQHNFHSRRYTGISPGTKHSDSYSGVLTHQSKYAGPGQLPRVCLGRPNLLLTFSGTSLSKCVQSPVRAKPSVYLPKTRAYRLSSDLSPRFSAKFEETSRKRIRNSYEEGEDDAAKRQCKADELTNCDEFEEDSVNLKRAREDSPKSDVDQQSQKSKKRVCNNEFLSSLSSSRNLLHTSARKRKAAVVDWSRSSTPVQEKLFKKSVGSPDFVINNYQESAQRLTEENTSVSQERLQLVVKDGSDKCETPVATSSPPPEKSTEKSQISNYTLFDIPISMSDTSVQENSTINIYADLNSSLEAVPKIFPEKKTFDTKELEREAISKRLSSFWDAFGSVDVNKARNAMAPQKSSPTLNSLSPHVATTSAPALIAANSVVTSTLQQPSLSNILEQKETNVSVNVVDKTDSIKTVATSAESVFTYGQSLSRSRELSSSLNFKNLVDSPAAITSTATTSAEISSDQNKFTISSSPSAPLINGSEVAPLTESSDLQRSKSSVSLAPNLLLTPSSVAISSSGLLSTSKEVPSSIVLTPTQAVGTVLTSTPFSCTPFSSAPTNTTSSITPNKPLFGFTSPLSANIKTSPTVLKQNSSVVGERKVGGFAFNFNTPATTASDEKKENKSLSSNFSVPQTTCSAVSSAHVNLNSASSVITPSQGGFSFPKLTSSSNHVDTPKAPSIFGSSQTSSGFGTSQTSSGFGSSQTSSGLGNSQTPSGLGSSQASSGFGSSQTSSGFGSSQTSAGFGNTQTLASGFGIVPTGGLSKVEALPAKFGSVEGTPVQGFGNTQVTSAGGFSNIQTSTSGSLIVPCQITSVSSFGNVPSSSSGFGNVQTTSEGGFSNVQATPKSVFENAQATPSGFGNAPAKSGAEFVSAQSPASSNIFGTSQTATNSTTAAFSFGAPNVQKTASAFSFGTSTSTTSSADTPVQSSGFGSTVTPVVQPQTSQLVLFSGGSNANKTQAYTDGTKSNAFVFGGSSTTPKPGGFAFGSTNSSQPSTSTSVTFNFGSNATSQAPTITSGKFTFGSPHSQSSGMPTTQPQLSFGSGSGISSQLSQSPFATHQSQQPTSATATMQKPSLSFCTPQPSFGIQQMQNSTMAQQPQVPFSNVQPQTSGASSLMQPPQMANVNPLLQSAGQQPSPFAVQTQQPSPFGAQAQQPQGGGGFSFTASMPQQQQQQPAPIGGLFGASSQTSTFQFGSAPPGTSQSTGGFSFGNAASSSTSVAPAVNFSAGSNANNLFQVGASGGFGGSSAGMFSIGSGSTAPRVKASVRSRKSMR